MMRPVCINEAFGTLINHWYINYVLDRTIIYSFSTHAILHVRFLKKEVYFAIRTTYTLHHLISFELFIFGLLHLQTSDCRVKSVKNQGLEVKCIKHSVNGFLPFCHLSDLPALCTLMSTNLAKSDVLSDVVCFTDDDVTLSKKRSVTRVEANITKTLDQIVVRIIFFSFY